MARMPYRSLIDRPPQPQPGAQRLARQQAGDLIPERPFGEQTKMRLMQFNRQMDADMARREMVYKALVNNQLAPASSERSPVKADRPAPAPAPRPAAEDPAVPKPKLKPRATEYTIKKGDNPTKIARAFGLTLKELEAKNPGILKRARRLQIGATVKV